MFLNAVKLSGRKSLLSINHPNLDLSNTKVFASMGKMDPIVPVSESEHVKAIFEDHGASFEEIWVRSHQIEMSELKAASEWIKNTLA